MNGRVDGCRTKVEVGAVKSALVSARLVVSGDLEIGLGSAAA